MSLEIYGHPDELYLSRGEDVNPRRPLFTGDVLLDVPIPGVQEGGMAMLVAHPCTMRGRNAELRPRLLLAAVQPSDPVGRSAWTHGFFNRMPLEDLLQPGDLFVACLDETGNGLASDALASERIACLSAFGINLLQQRQVWHLTRLEVETVRFQEAFSHTLEEADLLEEWSDELCPAGMSMQDAASSFEEFLREVHNDRTLQNDLRDPQRRSAVRIACRTEARTRAADLAQPS